MQDSVKLTGHIWIDELHKTHRRTDEKKKRGISRQQTPIYVAVDSHWNILFLRGKADGKPTIEDAKSAIVPHLGENISMITTDKNSCYDFLDQLGYKHEAIKADVGSTEYEAKMKQVNDLCSHLRDKLVSHNGIADRYLQRYLDLFWMVFNFAHKGLNTEKITHYLEKLVKTGTRTKRTDLWKGSKSRPKSRIRIPDSCQESVVTNILVRYRFMERLNRSKSQKNMLKGVFVVEKENMITALYFTQNIMEWIVKN